MIKLPAKYKVVRDSYSSYLVCRRLLLFFYERIWYENYYIDGPIMYQNGSMYLVYSSFLEADKACKRFLADPSMEIIGTLVRIPSAKVVKYFYKKDRRSIKRLIRKGLIKRVAEDTEHDDC